MATKNITDALRDIIITQPEGTPEGSSLPNKSSNPTPCILVVGMAGAGKTTFVQRLTAHLHSKAAPPYVINLDPAVHKVPYPVNIDIRDTVNYKEVMKQYGLGPNGGILTSLNLFSTQFDQVLRYIEKRANEHSLVIIDTPGQLEVFTWSASGTIITDTLGLTLPTIVVYVLDTSRSVNPTTFMANMLNACSILYKTTLPFILVMNKCDIIDNAFAVEWMKDFTVFRQALTQETSFMSNLVQSMSLALEEFYSNITSVGVSSLTGAGINEFLAAVDKGTDEYWDYLERRKKLNDKRDKELKEMEVHKLSEAEKQSGKGTKLKMGLDLAVQPDYDPEDEVYGVGGESPDEKDQGSDEDLDLDES